MLWESSLSWIINNMVNHINILWWYVMNLSIRASDTGLIREYKAMLYKDYASFILDFNHTALRKLLNVSDWEKYRSTIFKLTVWISNVSNIFPLSESAQHYAIYWKTSNPLKGGYCQNIYYYGCHKTGSQECYSQPYHRFFVWTWAAFRFFVPWVLYWQNKIINIS